MRAIFLDVDGVLNTEDTTDYIGCYYGVEDAKVKQLKKIVDATDAVIVLSSTWRLGFDNKGHRLEQAAEYLADKLAKCDLKIFDKTKDYNHQRGKEIHEWLTRHPEVDQWVVLDDEWFPDFNYYGIGSHYVQTWMYTSRGEGGLTDSAVEQAIKILQGEFKDE